MAYCGIPETISGPYNQTLFLGCSISNFNCNLGWGAEQSTLSVSLVEDPELHPQSSLNGPIDAALSTITQQPEDAASSAFHQSNGVYNTNDPAKTIHKNLAFQAKSMEDNRDQENRFLSNDFKDFGKVCYDVNGVRTYWTNPDPGFLGERNVFNQYGYDILGVPVRFKFNDFVFGGIVSSWRGGGGQGGVKTYDVEIKSFASLLNGVSLIIGGYKGTVCSIIPNTSNNITNKNIAMPFPYLADLSSTPPVFSFYAHNATIEQGNIPNVLNIYGYLEYLGYKNKIYGNAGVTDEGIRAQYVYDAIVGLLGPNSDSNPDSQSPFSPYGAILTRALTINGNALKVDPVTTRYQNITLAHMGICPNSIAMDGQRRSRLKIDISEVPRPPKWVRLEGTEISLLTFISEVCEKTGYDFFVDFIPLNHSTISGIIKIRTISRRQQPRKNQIQNLVSYLASTGSLNTYSYGKEYTDVNTRTMYIGGKQKRLLQYKSVRLGYKQNTLVFDPWGNNGNGAMVDYNSYLGILSGGGANSVRVPNLLSTRRYSSRNLGGAAAVSDSTTFAQTDHFGGASQSRNITRGNYYRSVFTASTAFEGQFGNIGANIPLFNDNICPYFGVGGNGLVRQVYFDKNMGQMQIIFHISDIQSLTALPLGECSPYAAIYRSPVTPNIPDGCAPSFVVLENEIRAAGGGFLQWLTYCFDNVFSTDISEIIYKGFGIKYGFSPTSKSEFLSGMSAIAIMAGRKTTSMESMDNPMQVSVNQLSPKFQTLNNDLQRIHSFFADIAQEYYGKQYMMKLNEIAWYRDLSVAYDNNNNPIIIGNDDSGQPIYALEGSGKVYTNYSISTDGAWEEPGNFIDDTMIVGGIRSSWFTDETGKIGPIIGFNASIEKDNARRWARTQFLNNAIRYRPYYGAPYTTFDWSTVMAHMYNDPLLQDSAHEYIPINHSLSPDDYMFMQYISPSLSVPNSYGATVDPNKRYKMYVKGTASEDFVFLGANSTSPRAVVSISSPVYFGIGKNSTDKQLNGVMLQDGLLRLTRGSSVPSFLQGFTAGIVLNPFMGSTTVNGGLGANRLSEHLGFLRDLVVLKNILNLGHNNSYGEPNEFMAGSTPLISIEGMTSDDTILPRAAVPMFCALPIEYNDFTYGPWINHPGLIRNVIFPDSNNPAIQTLEVENLIGGVKTVVDIDLVPWNYGGMTALDEAVMLKIADEVNYQQVLESGYVQLLGFMNINLGYMLQYYGNLFSGPIITSIQVQISESGVITTLGLRTYSRKLGLFNKENADRIKAINSEARKRTKEINSKLMNLASKMGIRPGSLRIV